MPDIQTAFKQALSKTLADWDDEGEAPSVQPVSASFSQPTQPTQESPMKKTFNGNKQHLSRNVRLHQEQSRLHAKRNHRSSRASGLCRRVNIKP
jgi:hypothetical protein